MTFDQINDCIWAMKLTGETDNEFDKFVEKCQDTTFLRAFFKENRSNLQYFRVSIEQAIFDTTEDVDCLYTSFLDADSDTPLDVIFEPLGTNDQNVVVLQRNKAKIHSRESHDCWVRIYALRLNSNQYVITGGAIKLTRTLQEMKHTKYELEKINRCRNFLIDENVKNEDDLSEFITENSIL